jgi:uncharacterized Zn-finger protein
VLNYSVCFYITPNHHAMYEHQLVYNLIFCLILQGPFKCHICGKEFSKSSQCKRHVKCHSDDKPFLCNLCSSSFNVEVRKCSIK